MSKKTVMNENEVSELYQLVLGGYRQSVLVEGKSKNLPIVITLHGGPGSPMPMGVGARGLFPQFTKECIMVYWDQLGCGINNYVIDDSFTINSFVQMTIDLINEIKALFPKNKIYLFATSWGSILSAKLLERYPNIVDGVVVSGQIVKEVFFNREVMETLENAKISHKKLEKLHNVNVDNVTPKDLQLVSSCLRKYTNAYTNKLGKSAPMGKMIIGFMKSPDYTFADFKAMVINGYQKNTSLWNEILKIDLSETLSKVKVPYIILQGDTDIVASTKTVLKTVKISKNSNLQCKVIDNTGHLPGQEMMEEIYFQMVDMTGRDYDIENK